MTDGLPKTTVVACIIENTKGEVLICRGSDESGERQPWTFPCALAKPGETPEAAMRRVALATVGVEIDIHTGQPPFVANHGDTLAAYRFFIATIMEGEPAPVDCEEVRWVLPAQLCEYDFAQAHCPVVEWYSGPHS
jgi:A/G-specific adenine glycosylase